MCVECRDSIRDANFGFLASRPGVASETTEEDILGLVSDVSVQGKLSRRD